jgi:hypothetical protein
MGERGENVAQTKYEKIIMPNLEVISGMAKKGVPEKDIAKHFKVAYSTFRKYKDEHKELRDALEYGVDEANAILSGTLFELAKGFYREVEKPMKIKRSEYENGKKVKEYEEIEYVTETQYFPPNMPAIAFWLTNHENNKYSKNPKTEIAGDEGGVIMLSDIMEEEDGK